MMECGSASTMRVHLLRRECMKYIPKDACSFCDTPFVSAGQRLKHEKSVCIPSFCDMIEDAGETLFTADQAKQLDLFAKKLFAQQ